MYINLIESLHSMTDNYKKRKKSIQMNYVDSV